MRPMPRGLLSGVIAVAVLLIGLGWLLRAPDDEPTPSESTMGRVEFADAQPLPLPTQALEPSDHLVEALPSNGAEAVEADARSEASEATANIKRIFEVVVVDHAGRPVADADVEIRRMGTRVASEARLRELEQRTRADAGFDVSRYSGVLEMSPGSYLEGNLVEPLSRARTDETGACRMTCGDPIAYVSAYAEGVGSSGESRIFGASGDDASGPTRVRLVLRPMGRVSGRVLSPNGQPFAAALVHSDAEDSRRDDGTVPTPLPPILTDHDGRFEVSIDAPAEVYFAARSGGDLEQGSDAAVVRLEAGGTAEVTLRMRGAHSLLGTVIDDEGRPVAEAKVELRVSKHERSRSTTDAEGRFEFQLSSPGEYRVVAEHPGLIQEGPALCVVDIEQPIARPTIVMLPAATIRGSARMSSGEPVRGVVVFAQPEIAGQDAERIGFAFELGMEGYGEEVAEDGSFALEAIHPDHSYRVYCSMPEGQGSATARGVAPGSDDVELIVGSEQAAGCTLILQVVDAVTSRPVPNVELELGAWSWNDLGYVLVRERIDDPAGRFEYENAHRGGMYGVRVEAPGYPSTLFPPIVAAGERMEQQLRLGGPGRLEVRVLNEDGSAAPDALVRGWRARAEGVPVHEPMVGASADSDGLAGLDDLIPGRYLVVAYMGAQRSELVEVEVRPLETQRSSLRLRDVHVPGSLVFEVRCGGAPVSGATAQLWAASDEGEPRETVLDRTPEPTGRTTANGVCKFEALAPGLYVVRVLLGGFEIFDRDVVIEPGQESRLPIEIGG